MGSQVVVVVVGKLMLARLIVVRWTTVAGVVLALMSLSIANNAAAAHDDVVLVANCPQDFSKMLPRLSSNNKERVLCVFGNHWLTYPTWEAEAKLVDSSQGCFMAQNREYFEEMHWEDERTLFFIIFLYFIAKVGVCVPQYSTVLILYGQQMARPSNK